MSDTQRKGPDGQVSIARKGIRWASFNLERYLMFAHIKYVLRNPHVRGRVTVITPTYKRPKGLKEAIASVRTQTYGDWEHIVVSDGPDERAAAIVAAFADPRIIYRSTRRTGGWGNYQRNYALKFATGEFTLFLDDDNVIFPHCLATMVEGFTSNAIGFVLSSIKYGDDRIMAPSLSFQFKEIDLLNFMIRRRLVERIWGMTRHHAGDFVMIDRVRRLSRGRVLIDLIGHHR